MLTWFPPVNEIKVQTWRRETVQTSSGGGALVKTALKLLVFFRREHGAVVWMSSFQKCNVRGENTGPDIGSQRKCTEMNGVCYTASSSRIMSVWRGLITDCVRMRLETALILNSPSETHELHWLIRLLFEKFMNGCGIVCVVGVMCDICVC